MEISSEPEWKKTVILQQRLNGRPGFEPPSAEAKYGKWLDRSIIGRDSPINGGVYMGEGEREAIVVDDKKQPELVAAYQELLKRRAAAQQHGETFKSNLLGEVFDLARELLPYSNEIVARVTQGLQPDQKIALSSFLISHGGVCRHQALLCAYLLEKLKVEGRVSGQVSIDRNYLPDQGGHAWVRYINSAGKVYIIDPAMNFAGRIDEAENSRLYQRPEEKR